MNNDPELLKLKTKDDEIKDLKYKTENHDHENIMKSLKIDKENYKKKYRSLDKKKIFLIISEILIGSASTVSSSTLAILNPTAGIFISSSTALLTRVAKLITKEYISEFKKKDIENYEIGLFLLLCYMVKL